MAINWDRVHSQGSLPHQIRELSLQLDEHAKAGRSFRITDLVAHASRRGGDAIRLMEQKIKAQPNGKHSKLRFRFKLLKHTDGREPQPGDEFFWQSGDKTHYTDDESGEVVPHDTRSMQIFNSMHEERGDRYDLAIWDEVIIDENCEFEVNFNQAMDLITLFTKHGIHPSTSHIKLKDGGETWFHIVKETTGENRAQNQDNQKKKSKSFGQ